MPTNNNNNFDERVKRIALKLIVLTVPRLKETPTLGPRGPPEGSTPEGSTEKPPPLPEERLNVAILRAAILLKVMNGFGALAFVWATVVLLGGFSTLLSQRDFWFVTAISFIQAVGIFGGNEDSSNQFAARVSEALLGTERLPGVIWEHDIWRRHRDPTGLTWESLDPQNSMQSILQSIRLRRACLGTLLTAAFSSAQLAAVTVLLVLSSIRLSKQDYVDPMFQGDQEHKPIRRSLNMFYGLVLAQGICYLCSIFNPVMVQFLKVRKSYKLGFSGTGALGRYVDNNCRGCVRGDVSAALNMDLVSFAINLAMSNSASDQLLGVRTIDDILSVEQYRKQTLASLAASPETLQKLIMLALGGPAATITSSPQQVEISGAAASIVLDLAPCLTVQLVPGMIQLVSGLLDEKICGNTELTWFGLSIIKSLMNNPNNCLDAVEAAGRLVPKVILLINRYGHDRGNDSKMSRSSTTSDSEAPHMSTAGQHHVNEKTVEEILEMSLRILHKLFATDAEAVKVLKRDTEENILFLSNARLIMGHVEAIRIIACCTLDEEAREEIGKYPEIIKALKDCLLNSGQEERSAAAAEALVLLTTDSESNVAAVLEETDSKQMQQVVAMLFVADGGPTTSMAAKLLRNLRAYSGTEYPHHHLPNMMHIIDRAMPEVLLAIEKRVTSLRNSSANTSQNSSNNGKVLESFVGLAVQICASLNSCDFFAENHEIGSHPTIDTLVQKLQQILQMYHSPTTEIPGIRRDTIELMIWIMQGNRSNIASFQRFNVAAELEQVVRSARKLESFRLFYKGVGVAKYNKPVSCVARMALALIAQDPAS